MNDEHQPNRPTLGAEEPEAQEAIDAVARLIEEQPMVPPGSGRFCSKSNPPDTRIVNPLRGSTCAIISMKYRETPTD
jgi:hypothetical protein